MEIAKKWEISQILGRGGGKEFRFGKMSGGGMVWIMMAVYQGRFLSNDLENEFQFGT
jgi:hypothetical protein